MRQTSGSNERCQKRPDYSRNRAAAKHELTSMLAAPTSSKRGNYRRQYSLRQNELRGDRCFQIDLNIFLARLGIHFRACSLISRVKARERGTQRVGTDFDASAAT